MAIANTVTLGNFGRAVINSPWNNQIFLPKIYDFEWRRNATNLKREYISGEREKFSFPDGYSGRFSFDRIDAQIENAFINADYNMDVAGAYKNWDVYFWIYGIRDGVSVPNAVTSDSGLQSTEDTAAPTAKLVFHNAACTLSEGGTYRQNAVVTQTITFESASLNYIVTGGANITGQVNLTQF